MSRFSEWLRWLLTQEPAVAAWVSSGGLAVILAYVPWFHLDHTKEAAAATILAGLATLWTAFWAKRGTVAALTGALVTVAGGLAAFGYHVPPHTIAITSAVLGVLMGLGHRLNQEPATPTVPPPANTPA